MTRVPKSTGPAESNDAPDGQRIFAYVGGIGLVASYALPWARVTDPAVVDTGATTLRGNALATLPEVAVGLGVVALALTALRWGPAAQVLVGVVGLVAVTVGLVGRAWLASAAGALDLGAHEGPAAAFEPALALLVVIGAGTLLIAGGFGAALEWLLGNSSTE